MHVSTALLLVFALLSANKTYAAPCFKQAGSDVVLNQDCTSGKTTIQSKSDEFTIEFSGDAEETTSEGTLKIGDCSMDLKLFKSPGGGSILSVKGTSIDLKTTATVKQGSIGFSRKDGSSYVVSPSCAPIFEQVDGRNTISVDYSMGPAASDFFVIFKDVSIYPKDENDGGKTIGIIFAVLSIALLLSGSVGGGFFFFRRRKNKEQAKRVREEDEAKLAKAEAKNAKTIAKQKVRKDETVAKQVDETKSKDLEEVPFTKNVKAHKPASLPSEEILEQLPAVNKAPKDGYIPRAEIEAGEYSPSKMYPSRNRMSRNRMRSNVEELRIDEAFPDSNEEQLNTAILPE